MLQSGREYKVGDYRYGFNGKENDDEVKGEGNYQDYGMRIYDPRLGRFISVDPISKEYPELTPYQFASNRAIDGVDQDGLEYKSAANWAQLNIANHTFGWDDVSTASDMIPFRKLRKPNWREIVGKYLYCATSTSLAYAQGNSKIADYLATHKFETNRIAGQLAFFTKYKTPNNYLIAPKDVVKADRGDLLFIQDPTLNTQGSGHVAILANATRMKAKGFTVNVYTTNAGVSTDPNKESNTVGEAIYYFEKLDEGKYRLAIKYYKNTDNNSWLQKDMRSHNLMLQGFGRVEEEKIDKNKPK